MWTLWARHKRPQSLHLHFPHLPYPPYPPPPHPRLCSNLLLPSWKVPVLVESLECRASGRCGKAFQTEGDRASGAGTGTPQSEPGGRRGGGGGDHHSSWTLKTSSSRPGSTFGSGQCNLFVRQEAEKLGVPKEPNHPPHTALCSYCGKDRISHTCMHTHMHTLTGICSLLCRVLSIAPSVPSCRDPCESLSQ